MASVHAHLVLQNLLALGSIGVLNIEERTING
jgi:hypothetical protein